MNASHVSAVVGLTAVLAGAFGAHALAPRLAELGTERIWSTAVLFHLIHAVALLALSARDRRTSAATWAWVVGLLLFCGALYTRALGGPRWLGMIAPVGGLGLMAGWVLSAFSRPPPSRDAD